MILILLNSAVLVEDSEYGQQNMLNFMSLVYTFLYAHMPHTGTFSSDSFIGSAVKQSDSFLISYL